MVERFIRKQIGLSLISDMDANSLLVVAGVELFTQQGAEGIAAKYEA
jgi:hypothetical protein